MARLRAVHLVHSTDLGGVETAAARLQSALRGDPDLDYRLWALADTAPRGARAFDPDLTAGGLDSPRALARCVSALRTDPPEVLITSLWRSSLVGLAANLPAERTEWAVYLHNTRWTNRLDALVHRLALPRAAGILADSDSARRALVPARLQGRTAVVRPVAAPLDVPHPAPLGSPVRLLFWGRLARQKRLDRTVDLLALLDARRPGGFALDLVGPDHGEWDPLRERARQLGVAERITWHGPLDRAELAGHVGTGHLFVQLSDHEGLGMSATEASAVGLVPVVTPVGDVGTTTRDGHGAIHVGRVAGDRVHVTEADLHRAADRITDLVDDPAAFGSARARARAIRVPDFVRDFRSAVLDLGEARSATGAHGRRSLRESSCA